MCNIGYEVAKKKKKHGHWADGRQASLEKNGQQGTTIAATSLALKLALILFRGA